MTVGTLAISVVCVPLTSADVVLMAREMVRDAIRLSTFLSVMRHRSDETTAFSRALTSFSFALREPIAVLESDMVRSSVDGIRTPAAVDFIAKLMSLAQGIFDETSYALQERINRQDEQDLALKQGVLGPSVTDPELFGADDQRLLALVIDVLTTNLTMVVRLIDLGRLMASMSRL